MTLRPNDYKIQIPYIQKWLDSRPNWKLEEELGPLSLATSVPIIVVCQFIGELYGFTPELVDRQQRLMKFYKVDKLV